MSCCTAERDGMAIEFGVGVKEEGTSPSHVYVVVWDTTGEDNKVLADENNVTFQRVWNLHREHNIPINPADLSNVFRESGKAKID